ncbi:MAG: hypothetical protein R3A13_06935 [Bdellovibrionota bacterium]
MINSVSTRDAIRELAKETGLQFEMLEHRAVTGIRRAAINDSNRSGSTLPRAESFRKRLKQQSF